MVDLLPGGFEVVVNPPAESSDSDEGDSDEGDSDRHDSDEEGSHEGDGDGDGEGDGSHDKPERSAKKTSAAPSQLPIAKDGSTWTPEYGDVREDRVVLYGSVGPEVMEFIYAMRATNAGSFAVPPLQGESMYDRSVMARSTGSKIRVVKE